MHLYGRFINLDPLKLECDRHGIFLIEDCAQAHGARRNQIYAGTVGTFGAWSFYPTKNLGAIGDAGALTSSDDALIQTARMIRDYGQSDRYHHEFLGLNSRLDELQAGLLLQRLPYLETWTNRRQQIAAQYQLELNNPSLKHLALPDLPYSHVYHLYVLNCKTRDNLQNVLQNSGIQTLIHYPIPCHQQPALKEYRISPSGLKHTENHCSTCISIPIHPFLSDREVQHVIDVCNSYNG